MNSADPQLAGCRESVADVLSEYAGGESVGSGVDPIDRILKTVEWSNRQNRTEDLLTTEGRRLGHVRKQCGMHNATGSLAAH